MTVACSKKTLDMVKIYSVAISVVLVFLGVRWTPKTGPLAKL